MTSITARYDGRVLVPAEPLDVPVNENVLLILLRPAPRGQPSASGAERAAAIRRWATASPPAPVVLDDSRASIYADDER